MRTWRMFAGRPTRVIEGREFLNFGDRRYVEMHGRTPVEVELTEDPEGDYLGWIRTPDPNLPRRNEGVPTMIQPHPSLFRMQFPYGPDAEVEAGRGEIVRMTCKQIC